MSAIAHHVTHVELSLHEEACAKASYVVANWGFSLPLRLLFSAGEFCCVKGWVRQGSQFHPTLTAWRETVDFIESLSLPCWDWKVAGSS